MSHVINTLFLIIWIGFILLFVAAMISVPIIIVKVVKSKKITGFTKNAFNAFRGFSSDAGWNASMNHNTGFDSAAQQAHASAFQQQANANNFTMNDQPPFTV